MMLNWNICYWICEYLLPLFFKITFGYELTFSSQEQKFQSNSFVFNGSQAALCQHLKYGVAFGVGWSELEK